VLVDIKSTHYHCLNKALEDVDKKFVINWTDHLSKFDGLKTKQKLELLTIERGLPIEQHTKIFEKKQIGTLEAIKKIKKSEELKFVLSNFEKDGYKIACCSNSVRKTVITALSKLGVIEHFDMIISNEDVNNGKPHPEMYWKAISSFKLQPEEVLIIEDSPNGLLAAHRSSANVMRVSNSKEITYTNICEAINSINNSLVVPKWRNKKLNVLIPMAGAGSRFELAGFKKPKPLIDVNGSPMIKVVTENLNIEANFIYIVQSAHYDKYNLEELLPLISPSCKIIKVDGLTEGAACTSLLAKDYINNDNPLLIANSDQFIEWDSNQFFYKMHETDADGGIVTFKAIEPKWSFARVNKKGLIIEVAEKRPISSDATAGVYYWKNGCDYVKYAVQMIEKNIRTNNEFYICPVFNEAIRDNKKIYNYPINRMHGLGTPEDLKNYLEKLL
jgi:HAD superfamily hydrolase (TIGR01509 family)